jgi:hypothetical protein
VTKVIDPLFNISDVPQIVVEWYAQHPEFGPLDYQDNIERILCWQEGRPGHDSCGYCHTCGAPNFCGCGCPGSRGGFNEALKKDRKE